MSNSFFSEFIFPFLLLFAILFSALQNVGIFKSKKHIVFIVSFIVSFLGVYVRAPSGDSLGMLMAKLFPNISIFSIVILTLYVIGALLGKNFFKGLFGKEVSSYAYQSVGVLGLGGIIYFVGKHLGFFKAESTYWNIVFVVVFIILGVVLLLTRNVAIGVILLSVSLIYLFGKQSGNILDAFYDPFILIMSIIIMLIGWMNSPTDKKEELREGLKRSEKSIQKYEANLGRKPKDYESRIFDIVDSRYQRKKKKWNEKYPNENYD